MPDAPVGDRDRGVCILRDYGCYASLPLGRLILAMIPDDDSPEVAELEAAAEWRLRQVDAAPDDARSAAAARQLQALAEGLRQLRDSPLLRELHALCSWLDESDNITDFSLRAHEFRTRIGFDRHVETTEEYIRVLIDLAKDAM
jgi:hypothetical protein